MSTKTAGRQSQTAAITSPDGVTLQCVTTAARYKDLKDDAAKPECLHGRARR